MYQKSVSLYVQSKFSYKLIRIISNKDENYKSLNLTLKSEILIQNALF